METVFNQSLWGDEGFSAILSMKSYPEILKIISRDTSPPLWNTFEWLMFNTFGTDEVYIRTLSLLFFLGTAYFTYKIGTFLWNSKTGLLAAALTILNPFFFTYAFEGRMYSIMAMGVAGSMYFFIKLFYLETGKVQKKDKIGYIIFTLWALYSHHFAIFAVFVQGIWWFYELVFGKRQRAFMVFKLFVLTGIGYIPWLYPLYTQTKQVAGGFWLGKPTISDFFNLLADYLAKGTKTQDLTLPLVDLKFFNFSFYISILVLGSRIWWKDFKKSFVPLLWFLGPILIAYVVSQLFQSIFYNRYILYTIPGAMLILASKRGRVSGILLTVLIGSFLIIDFNYFTHPAKLPFKTFSEEVKSQLKTGDFLVNWYDNGTHHIWETKYYGLDAPIYVSQEGGSLPYFVGTALMEEKDIIREIPETATRVGAITSGSTENIYIPGFIDDGNITKNNLKLVWLARISGNDNRLPALSPDMIAIEINKTDKMNNSLSKEEIYERKDELIGTDSKNGKILIRKSYCSDLCPAAAYLGIYYKDVDRSECERIGGIPVISTAWRSYIGCGPNIKQ